jgi:hypothetical protein
MRFRMRIRMRKKERKGREDKMTGYKSEYEEEKGNWSVRNDVTLR